MLLNCGVGEDSWKSPLDCKEIKPVNPKGNQPWIFIGRTDAEAETPILWPPDAKNWLTEKYPNVGLDWRQEKGMTEDEMVGWHHWLDGHEFEQAPGVGNGQGSLACCSPWCHKELDMTERLNWTDSKYSLMIEPLSPQYYIGNIKRKINITDSLQWPLGYSQQLAFLRLSNPEVQNKLTIRMTWGIFLKIFFVMKIFQTFNKAERIL